MVTSDSVSKLATFSAPLTVKFLNTYRIRKLWCINYLKLPSHVMDTGLETLCKPHSKESELKALQQLCGRK